MALSTYTILVFPCTPHCRRVKSYGTAINQMQSLSTVNLVERDPSKRKAFVVGENSSWDWFSVKSLPQKRVEASTLDLIFFFWHSSPWFPKHFQCLPYRVTAVLFEHKPNARVPTDPNGGKKNRNGRRNRYINSPWRACRWNRKWSSGNKERR